MWVQTLNLKDLSDLEKIYLIHDKKMQLFILMSLFKDILNTHKIDQSFRTKIVNQVIKPFMKALEHFEKEMSPIDFSN